MYTNIDNIIKEFESLEPVDEIKEYEYALFTLSEKEFNIKRVISFRKADVYLSEKKYFSKERKRDESPLCEYNLKRRLNNLKNTFRNIDNSKVYCK